MDLTIIRNVFDFFALEVAIQEVAVYNQLCHASSSLIACMIHLVRPLACYVQNHARVGFLLPPIPRTDPPATALALTLTGDLNHSSRIKYPDHV